MAYHQQVQPLLAHFGQLFLLCKLIGLYPHDLQAFRSTATLQKSKTGTWIVIGAMITIVAFYNLLIASFSDENRALKATQSTLTFVIGIFLRYIGLVMMLTDQWAAIRNQSQLTELYDRIRIVDERLYKEHIIVETTTISRRIRIMILITVACEVIILVSTYVTLIDFTRWTSILWIFSCFPTLYNSLDKIWFAMTLYALHQRFFMINSSLDEMVDSHEKLKEWMASKGDSDGTTDAMNAAVHLNGNELPPLIGTSYDPSLEYLYKELTHMAAMKALLAKNRIMPIAHSMNSFGEDLDASKKQQQRQSKHMYNMVYESELNNDIQKVEEKLNNLCQLHDEICEIGKTLNELWSYPILMLMAYGFLIFTAQLYFLYCATQSQIIPSLFRSAKSAIITAVYLSYTAGKCIYLIYLSWKTALESKRTGICLHKCGVVADNDLLYEIVNHLSLKLLNHSVDFSACGFFTLDMETLYGVSGGITSYLIILIQFNLAAQQAKDALHSNNVQFNETANLVASSDEGNVTSLLGLITTTILPNGTDEF